MLRALPLLPLLVSLLVLAPSAARAQAAPPPRTAASLSPPPVSQILPARRRRRVVRIPPWRLVVPDAFTAARLEGVLARYAFDEREGRDVALAVGVYAGAAAIAGATLMALPRETGGGGDPVFAAPWFIVGAACITAAALFRLPGPLEVLRDDYHAALRATPGPAPAPLVWRTEDRLARLLRSTASARRVVAPITIGFSATLAAVATAAVLTTAVGAANGATLSPLAYASLPAFGVAAILLAVDIATLRDDLARAALRDVHDAMSPAAVARPQPAL